MSEKTKSEKTFTLFGIKKEVHLTHTPIASGVSAANVQRCILAAIEQGWSAIYPKEDQ